MNTRRAFPLLLLTACLVSSAAFFAPLAALADDQERGAERRLPVMTRNLYPGIDDPSPIIAALLSGDTAGILMSVEAAWQQVCATDFPTRSAALADEIAARRPLVLALQEAAIWRTQDPADFDPTPNAEHVEFDFLETLLSDLRARHLHYEPVAVQVNVDLELPRYNGGVPQDVRWTDRDVLLVRTNLPGVTVARTGSGTFATLVDAGGGLLVPRGWVSADLRLTDRLVRVIGTHLEDMDDSVRQAQAQELLDGPASWNLPTLLLGDFNSNALGDETSGAYGILRGAGFRDAWSVKHPTWPGLTCCQNASLTVDESQLSERIDLVLFRGPFAVETAQTTGDRSRDRVVGLWPSDHAGVSVDLRLVH